MIWFLFSSCQQTIRAFQTLDIVSERYELVEQDIISLSNPRNMEGFLGDMNSGGVFKIDVNDASLSYQGGRKIELQYQVKNEILYPVDRDGLILLSFYAHLEEVYTTLQNTVLDVEQLFPVKMSVSPILADLSLAFLPFENAAYVPEAHHFILLPDLLEKDVPLAANRGVVAHEFGHAIFHWLTTGGTTTERWIDPTSKASNSILSLDEGLADVMGALISEQSNFISYSLDMPERDLAGSQLASEVEVLPQDATQDSLLPSYDPYPLGSIYSAMVWDIHSQLQDRILMLNWVFRTTKRFAEEEGTRGLSNNQFGYLWLDYFVDEAADDEYQAMACEAIGRRFQDVYQVGLCL